MAEGGVQSCTETEDDAFIAHITDNNQDAKELHEFLLANNLKVFACYSGGDDFGAGKVIFHGIVNKIRKSRITLVLLSKEALNSLYVRIEILLALDKSLKEKRNCIKLLLWKLDQNTENEMKQKVFSRLPEFCFYQLASDRQWTESDVREIMAQEEMECSEGSDYMGNIAHAFAYSYYAGFLGTILKDFTTALDKHEDPDVKKTRMLKKFYVVLPDSCISLEEYMENEGTTDPRIQKMKKAIYFKGWHAGVDRDKDAPVYRVEADGEEFFFVGESPSVIRPFVNLNKWGFAKLQSNFELARFKFTLTDLLFQDSMCPFKQVEVIWFDDKKEKLVDVLLPVLKMDLEQPPERCNLSQYQMSHKEEECGEQNIMVLFEDGDQESQSVYGTITQRLDEKEILHSRLLGGNRNLKSLEHVNWCVFILTQSSIQDQKLMLQLDCMFQESVDKRKIKVICVKYRLKYSDPKFPKNASLCVCLDAESEKDMEALTKTVLGDNPSMTVDLHAGELATGLAWAFVENYMQHNLKDLRLRMEKKCPEGTTLIAKLFILFPESCNCPNKAQVTSEKEVILEKLDPIIHGTRKFFLQMFSRTLTTGNASNENQTVVYTREYSTPSMTLFNMAERFPWAGLSKEEMVVQQKRLAEKVWEIIRRPDVKESIFDLESKCEIIFFDDTDPESLDKVLEERIKACI